MNTHKRVWTLSTNWSIGFTPTEWVLLRHDVDAQHNIVNQRTVGTYPSLADLFGGMAEFEARIDGIVGVIDHARLAQEAAKRQAQMFADYLDHLEFFEGTPTGVLEQLREKAA